MQIFINIFADGEEVRGMFRTAPSGFANHLFLSLSEIGKHRDMHGKIKMCNKSPKSYKPDRLRVTSDVTFVTKVRPRCNIFFAGRSNEGVRTFIDLVS